MSASADRRANERRPVTQEVMLSQGPHFRLCHLRNLSVDGAFLDIGWGVLTRSVPVEILLTLPLGSSDSRVYHIPAEVTRVTPDGTALRFSSLASDASKALSEFLACA